MSDFCGTRFNSPQLLYCKVRKKHHFANIEADYQTFLAKKEETEISCQDTQAELDKLMREVESFNNQLTVVIADEAVANDLVKSLPEEIKLLEVKIESASKLLFSES